MTHPPDTWEKSRNHHDHFTAAELAEIEAAFLAGHRAQYVAQKLHCSTRTINRHYAVLRADKQLKPRITPGHNRFYRSDFKL